MFSRSVNVWFVCKTCRGSFQKLDNFLEHKKQNHLEEFQETECIVFEESSISIQNNDEYRDFTSGKDATTAEAQMPSHSTNASRESRNFDEFPPVIVKIETLFEPNNDDVPSPGVQYPYDSSVHQDFPQSQDPTNYQNQIYSHPSFTTTTNGPNFDLTTAAVEAKFKSSTKTKKSTIVTHSQEGEIPFRKSVEQQQHEQKQHPPLNAFVLAKKLTVNEIQNIGTVKNDSNSFNKTISEDLTKSTNSPAHQKLMNQSIQNRMGFQTSVPVPAPANTQNNIVQLQCKLCSKKLNSLAELRSHQASCILTSRFQDRFCVLCNRVFCNSIYLKSHILRIHPTEEERARRRKLISELSPNAVVLRNSPLKKRPEPESSRKQSKPLKCSMCDMSFYCNSLLTLHLKSHYRDERAFKCSQPNCGKSYNLKKHLKQHLNTHFDSHLLSKFSKIKAFGKVSNSHRTQKATATATTQVSVLPYTTSSGSVASIVSPIDDPFAGQKTAQGQQPIQIFTDTSTAHLTSEPQPAPQFEFEFDLDGDYKCRLCLHKCDTAQDLRIHVATCALNHESRHCYCVTCNKKFPNSKILRVHTFRLHGYGHGHAPPEEKKIRPPKQPLPPRSYKCQICSKKYMYKLPFQAHMKSHYASKTDDRKTYKCHFCPKSFNYPSLLKYHLRTHPESEVNVASFAAVVENLLIQKKTVTKNIEKEPRPRSSENRAVPVPVPPPQHSAVVRSKIKNKTNKTNCGNFCCTYMDCDQTFKYRKPFRKHLLSHTGRIGTETIPGPGPGVRTSPGTGFTTSPGTGFRTSAGTGFRTSPGTGIGEGSVSDHLYSGKAFQRNLRFTNHLKTHAEDARRYRCPLPKCDKGFKFKTGIKRHLLFHADLRSFKCPHLNCEQTFEL